MILKNNQKKTIRGRRVNLKNLRRGKERRLPRSLNRVFKEIMRLLSSYQPRKRSSLVKWKRRNYRGI
jgi:thiamine biosynthesis lipoprotein ApbE